MRKLCNSRDITLSKLDKMNADLAKACAYDTLVLKRVTYLADIGNKAAHGKATEFENKDVEKMITDVRDFIMDVPD